MTLLSILFALGGLAAFGLSQPQHYSWARGRALTVREARTLRIEGSVLLAPSLGFAIAVWGLARGLVAWCGVLTLAAAVLLLLRAYGPPPRPPNARGGD